MVVASTVIAVGLAAGLAAFVVVVRPSTPDLGDLELERQRASRWRTSRWLARFVPKRAAAAVGESLAIAAAFIVVVAFVAGVTLIMIRTGTGLARADEPVAEWAARRASERSTTVMRELSRFGGTLYIVVGAIAVAVIGWWRDRRWAVPLFVAIAMIGQFLVSNSVKWSVDRARPAIENLTGYAGSSFPSGHAVAAAAAWATVAFVLGRGRGRWTRATLVGLAVALGVVVAGTRVALGVHWTTDVIIGLAIGWAWFAVCALLFDGRRLEPTSPVVADADATDSRLVGSAADRRSS